MVDSAPRSHIPETFVTGIRDHATTVPAAAVVLDLPCLVHKYGILEALV